MLGVWLTELPLKFLTRTVKLPAPGEGTVTAAAPTIGPDVPTSVPMEL